jgi:ABC-type molybdate transport system substrate-binding protein
VTPPGVTVFCDPALKPALRALDGLSRRMAGAPVAVLSAPAPLMLAQIQRHTRNDVLFTLAGAMDQAVALNIVQPATRRDGFSNPLVLAALAGRFAAGTALVALPVDMRIAVTDNTVVSGLDGFAVLTANGFPDAGRGQVTGVASTADVAFMLRNGAADAGLVYLTDVKADPALAVLASLSAPPALTGYAAAVNAKAVSPNAQAFLNIATGPQGAAILRDAGLELAA